MPIQSKNVTYHLGEKLRTVRQRKGYTLKMIADAAGVSESLVSQIERNKVAPAIDTLITLADVLDINLEYLFEEFKHDRPVHVIRGGQRRCMEEDEVRYEELARPEAQDGEHAMESYILTIPPHGHTHRGSYGHIGREMGYIIEGKARLQYDTSSYTLEAGDSVSFAANSPHTIFNDGDVELKAVWVVSPPQRFS